ncbi:hypothetical protein C8_4 [Cannes 8 virus]|uniref:Uncharacterized protein n=1 Tax=Marseillevirus marseillevirus TaxID=694581 RepID=D2XA20_GBMV|nr:hypothetical protein MAR_ORF004 [Marseillevirus marseillevirus]YP_009094505.1 hypothetical protein MEL_004 [Melbournevirus]AGV01353.1 hypothetical protein C8_4 [Cannes 8 virus]AVR52709.1 hypothetical protein MarSH_004 [Marseillevirus Shanghai 1]ADB03797.1 hypothetical protein MAR_ORF004 [Marseillevirus marseillevirus]AIT54617.1 hypothetical protein MEL_004 [Melbournevirus]
MSSSFLLCVVDLLQEKFLLTTRKDFEIICEVFHLWVTKEKCLRFAARTKKGRTICYWYEVETDQGNLLFSSTPLAKADFPRSVSEEKMLKHLKKTINDDNALQAVYQKKYKNAAKVIEELLRENETLKEENFALKFAPGGEEYLKAKEMFEQKMTNI